jgi:hypothetical protein
MRYRRLDAKGDMTFGRSQGNLWINQPEGVAQLVMTRLRLGLGEWFADTSDGTPWVTEVLGERTRWTRDVVVRDRVERTQDVTGIIDYGSQMDVDTRSWTAAMRIGTIYGPVAVGLTKLPATVPPLPSAVVTGVINASQLGVVGGTRVTMVPADLTTGPRTDVTDFQIQTLQAGVW